MEVVLHAGGHGGEDDAEELLLVVRTRRARVAEAWVVGQQDVDVGGQLPHLPCQGAKAEDAAAVGRVEVGEDVQHRSREHAERDEARPHGLGLNRHGDTVLPREVEDELERGVGDEAPRRVDVGEARGQHLDAVAPRRPAHDKDGIDDRQTDGHAEQARQQHEHRAEAGRDNGQRVA